MTRIGATNGAGAATKATVRRAAPRPQAAPRPLAVPKPPAVPKPQVVAKQLAAARFEAARARQRMWRVAWMFAIGLAIGGGWAYLYAQRRGPGYDALQQRIGGTPQT
jgi:hypothetical protein